MNNGCFIAHRVSPQPHEVRICFVATSRAIYADQATIRSSRPLVPSLTASMTSVLFNNLPPMITLETAIRTALAEEERLYHNLNDQYMARNSQLDGARLSINWLSNALNVTRVVLDSSADIVSVLSSLVENLSSVISIHGSDKIFGDLKPSLPSADAAKRSWESVAGTVDNLLVQIESLKSTTSSHTGCMEAELEAHKIIAHQSQMSLDTLSRSIDGISHSIKQKRSILRPIRRVPTEILEDIFELATLEERSALRGNLISHQTSHASRGNVYRTIPRIPTILASTCRPWRTIALNMPLLWSFLRVPTLERYEFSPHSTVTQACVVGLSTFQRAKLCIGTSECEIVVGPTDDWSMVYQHLSSIPRSQISIMNIVSPPQSLDFSQIPTSRVLRITRRSPLHTQRITGRSGFLETILSMPPPSYSLPTSVLADTRELDCHHALAVANEPILPVTSFSLTLNDNALFPDLGHALANFPNLTAVVLRTNIYTLYSQATFTPLHHARIRTLSITDAVLPHLCASLRRAALSLPSLTHFILLDISPSSNNMRAQWDQLQSLFVNVTCFDIRAAAQRNCGSDIRQLLNIMPLLQRFSLLGTAVNCGLDALLVTPPRLIHKLVILDSGTDGSNVNLYYDAFGLESTDRTGAGDDWGISIQFVNCPHVLPHIRERFSS